MNINFQSRFSAQWNIPLYTQSNRRRYTSTGEAARSFWHKTDHDVQYKDVRFIMVALCNRADHYIFAL